MNEAETKMMQLEPKHIVALEKAQALIVRRDFGPYLELKGLLPDSSSTARTRFRMLFINFYGLHRGGLTDEFKDRFFEILFGDNVIVNGQPNFSWILNELSGIKRKKDDFAMPFSFVSKLVGLHRENSPIYDQHVRDFFRAKVPAASVDKKERIEWFLGFLDCVGRSYEIWAGDARIRPVLEKLCARDTGLMTCDKVRLIDFLVWKVGNQKLL